MLDEELLSSFVGHTIDLRPAAGRDAHTRTTATEPLVARIIGKTKTSQLHLETNDVRVLELRDRAVHAESTSSTALFRLQGMLEVLDGQPAPLVCLLTPFDHPGALERRQWVRVPTEIPVTIDTSRGDEAGAIRTVSVDLSGGGIKLRAMDGVTVGANPALALELPSGTIQVRGEVMDVRGGFARLRFHTMSESVHQRIIRHIFSVQIELRKGTRDGGG